MGFFKKLLQATIDVVVVPIEVAKDVVTLGGAVLGRDETYTQERLEKAAKHLGEAYDELDSD